MKIEYSKQAIKFLEKQDIPTRKRLKTAIENLPYGDVKKCKALRATGFVLVISVSYSTVKVM